MNMRMLCLGVMAFSMIGGAALAGALDEPDTMAPFFTDSSMKTMKSHDEMKAAWDATPKAKQAYLSHGTAAVKDWSEV